MVVGYNRRPAAADPFKQEKVEQQRRRLNKFLLFLIVAWIIIYILL